MGYFAPCAFTDVTQSDLVIRWDGLEDPSWPQSPVWCLGVDGWKAELSCAHWLESLHMASPSWPPWSSQTFYREAGACLQRTRHDLLWPSLKSHIAHLRHVVSVKTVTNPPRFKRRGHGHYLSGKGVSQNLEPSFKTAASCLQFSHVTHNGSYHSVILTQVKRAWLTLQLFSALWVSLCFSSALGGSSAGL